ncbi:hypothetical protein ACFL6X_08575 [Candidatus Latescibacterota bacterium]
MGRMLWAPATIVTLGLLVSACADRGDRSTKPGPTGPTEGAGAPAEGTIKLAVSFAPWRATAAKVTGIESIDAATAYVYDTTGAEVTHESLSLSGGRASGRIAVLAQDNLRVALTYLDGSIVRYIGEDEDVDVAAGGETTADIVEHYMGTSVTAPDSVAVNSQYTVTWMARDHATAYQLEEATAADYSDAVLTYQGADTSYVAPGKTEADTFYYRARVNTLYGYGPWHSTGGASTGIPDVGGVIIIDVPIPPDEPGGGGYHSGHSWWRHHGLRVDRAGDVLDGHHRRAGATAAGQGTVA